MLIKRALRGMKMRSMWPSFSWGNKPKSYSVVKPGKVGPTRKVPDGIHRPPYISHGHYPNSGLITIKTREEIDRMHEVCKLARRILNEARCCVKPGMTTDQIDDIVHQLTIEQGAYPSPLLYKGFPKSCCTSVNNVALHGIPDDRALLEGDILNLDITIYKDELHGDLSETLIIGATDCRAQELVDITKKALDNAVSICAPDVEFTTIGKEIERCFEGTTFNVIPQICGHGIGYGFHECPDVIHVDHYSELRMKPGMVFTIEPCVSEGGVGIKLLEDGWTYVSVDNSRSAQFEHTIAITEEGSMVLTADHDVE